MKAIVIYGPTASGKSQLAIDLALTCGGCIVNADSMQLYTPLPILSAQPSEEDQKQVPHFLYGVLSAKENCSVHAWVEKVAGLVQKIRHKFEICILVGGTGFYLKGLLEGVSGVPEISPEIKKTVEKNLQDVGKEGLYRKLQSLDPQAAENLNIQDAYRVGRALEVFLETGRSIIDWQKNKQVFQLFDSVTQISLMPEREVLYAAINQRGEKMFNEGGIAEVAAVKDFSLGGCTHTLGYRQIKSYLEGKMGLDEALEKTQQFSRNYAKRQFTWFRHQMRPQIVISERYGPAQLKGVQDFLSF